MPYQVRSRRALELQRTYKEPQEEAVFCKGGNAEGAALVGPATYRLLGEFRYEIRKFLAFSERAARAAGIEPQQHQLLLAIKGLPTGARPTIRTIAERLCVQHHTAVALVDKLEQRALLLRERGTKDKREVLLRLTPGGDEILRGLSAVHRSQLANTGARMVEALSAIVATAGDGVSKEHQAMEPLPSGGGMRPGFRRARRTASEPG